MEKLKIIDSNTSSVSMRDNFGKKIRLIDFKGVKEISIYKWLNNRKYCC